MREILFRGKRETDNKWLYGFPYVTRKNAVKINWYCSEFGSMRTDEIIPETVGQYTGLTDKNDVRIFEGDILKQKTTTEFAKVNPFEWEKYGIVRFGVYDWRPSHQGYRSVGWYVEPLKKVPINPSNYGIGNINAGLNQVDILNKYYPYEVIGNIHDNPKLLTEGEKVW